MKLEIYKNYFKFIIAGALMSGALVFASGVIFFMYESWLGRSSGGMGMALFMGLYGTMFGFVAALIGFWIMFFLGKNTEVEKFSNYSIIVGGLLASAISIIYFILWGAKVTSWLFVMPGIPFVGSIYFFKVFAQKYILPLNQSCIKN